MSPGAFKCPFCGYVGADGLAHLKMTHPGRLKEYDDLVGSSLSVQKKTMAPTYTITRDIPFDAGHRVFQHESKCNHIHGHRYVASIQCAPVAGELDSLGRVVDFSVIKSVVGKWIDDNLDHGMILFEDDPLAKLWNWFGGRCATTAAPYPIAHLVEDAGQQKHFIMNANPTAENIARLIYTKANELLAQFEIKVTSVKIQETPNCFAVYGHHE